jgi:hypothetical protein
LATIVKAVQEGQGKIALGKDPAKNKVDKTILAAFVLPRLLRVCYTAAIRGDSQNNFMEILYQLATCDRLV